MNNPYDLNNTRIRKLDPSKNKDNPYDLNKAGIRGMKEYRDIKLTKKILKSSKSF